MRWDDLNMADKSRMMQLAINSGITDLRTIREVYNSYAEGGNISKEKEDKPKRRFSLANRKRIVDRVYGDTSNYKLYKPIRSAAKQYFTNPKNAVSDRIERLEEIRKKYNLEDASIDALLVLLDNIDDKELAYDIEDAYFLDAIKQHEDAKRIYFGFEPKYGTMEPSPYSPTIGNSENPYQVNPLLTDNEFDEFILPAWHDWKVQNTTHQVEDYGNTGQIHDVPYLSNAGISKGRDDKGDYLSLYDVWDYNTAVSDKSGDNVGKFIGGRPFEIYQRYYLDDWLDIPEENRGNPYIAPAVVQDVYPQNSYGEGGKIHIKPENRGKFTALKERTGKSASWFKAHGTPAQRKMATFALNARKWKHADGGWLYEEGSDNDGGNLFASLGNKKIKLKLDSPTFALGGNLENQNFGNGGIFKGVANLFKNVGVKKYDTENFNQAFRQARIDGKNKFIWNGNRYSTELHPTYLKKDETLQIPGLSKAQMKALEDTWNYFRGHNVSARNAAAVMGNMMQESSFNPSVVQRGGDSAIGYFQMHGDRLKDYYSYLNEIQAEDSPERQLDYMIDVMRNKRRDFYMEDFNRVNKLVGDILQKEKPSKQDSAILNYYDRTYKKRVDTDTLYPISDFAKAFEDESISLNDLTDLFTNTIERAGKPEYEKRRKYANSIYNYFYGVPTLVP